MRARILAGVATFTVACALAPNDASAQLLGTCPGLTPPPCIISDPGRIAGTAAEIKEKKQELETAIQQVKEYTTLNGVLGSVGTLPAELKSAITPPQNQAFSSLTNQNQPITISAAANALDAQIGSHAMTLDGKSAAESENALRLRAAAGEGFALALATKYKLCKMNQEARNITTKMQQVDNSAAGSDARANWAINQGARRLMFDAMLANREVQTARLQLVSLQNVPSYGTSRRQTARKEATPAEPEISPGFAVTIGDIANAANKLAALLAAKKVISGFTEGIKGSRETKSEYEQMKAAAVAAQARVESIAASDARRKGVPASTLLSIANQYMSQDKTAWDDPSKSRIAANLANAAEKALDKRVNGDVNDNWSDYLIQRAEAYKQEAFFRPIAADADAMEKQTIKGLAEYEQSLGVKASDNTALNTAISEAQNEVNSLKQQLNQAPAHVIEKANQILATSGIAEATAATPAATTARTPDWAQQYANY